MTPEDARHGTEAGHEQHMRDNETPCEPCYDAKIKAARRRTKRKTMGYRYTLPLGAANHQKIRDAYEMGGTHAGIGAWFGLCESEVWRYLNGTPEQTVYARTWARINRTPPFPRPVTAVGVTRRIQALLWLGHSPQAIADHAGVHLDTIRDARDAPRVFLAERVREGVARAYAELGMTLPDTSERYARAAATRVRGAARKAGYLPPLAWDDIDDPNERPDLGSDDSTPDPIAVERFVDGDQITLNRSERVEALRLFAKRGIPDTEAARRLGISDRTVMRIRVAHGIESGWAA